MADAAPTSLIELPVQDAFEPRADLTVSYGDRRGVHGEELTPTIVFHQPTLRWTAEEGKFYTVIFSDPDAPSAADPKFGDDVAAGEHLTEYVGSGPGQGSGKHRYCIVLYEQTRGRTEFDEPRLPVHSGLPPRRLFNSRAFAAKHGLVPIDGFMYLAEWDEMVPEVHKRVTPPAA